MQEAVSTGMADADALVELHSSLLSTAVRRSLNMYYKLMQFWVR